ncbi:hypothetical protein GALMADRAFT_238483 [Galerina marginata CBS 339.88]|uniref:Uncharacterized protein n=1 Tax=Galerina marginata (strain CBS 339.88) TaxID=685588 RepID=A0A067TKK1_GALM3|nr:hypothetical protein GALMADRAFT_238483 [Galerina marginata CBS 339.88]
MARNGGFKSCRFWYGIILPMLSVDPKQHAHQQKLYGKQVILIVIALVANLIRNVSTLTTHLYN